MSLFKIKPWWSNERLQSAETSEGLQNNCCLKVDKFNAHTDSDCVIVGEDVLLKIYKPYKEADATHTLLEANMNGAILQIETGKFIAGIDDRQILVLHSQSYAVYQLHRTEGHTDAGEQNALKLIAKHSFTRKAHSLTSGPFGNIKTRDFICIQALDGSLSFFDQETFLFMYTLNDVIIPGPIAYIASCDAFVICKSTWVLEIHSYQQLREFSEPNVRQNKKHIPQWVYNAGEEISSIQVIQTSNNISSIIALGERHLCCFQDNGLMKYMLRFEFMPICFYAYLIGWYYEPTARLLVMVSSEDSKLFIYERTSLLWCCDLLHIAISVSRCFVKSLPGGIVALSEDGIVTVGYLGTEPDLNSNAGPMVNEATDPEQIQTELEEVEESLKKVLDGDEDVDSHRKIDKVVNVKVDVGKPNENFHQEFTEKNEQLHLFMCPLVVMITCLDPKLIQSVQITFGCSLPFACSESTVCLENINGTEIIETQVYLSSEAVITDARVKVMLTFIDSTGTINVMIKEILLPVSFYCLPVEDSLVNKLSLPIETNHPGVNISDIFTDFSKEDLAANGNTETNITLMYRTTKATVTIKSVDKEYLIEANDYADITAILDNLLAKLTEYFKRMEIKDFRFSFKLKEEFVKTITHKFMKSVESHAKERVQLKKLEDDLDVLQRQFLLIQKKLLVQYGSLPPGDCDPLEFLMKDTHTRLVNTVHGIIQCKQIVCGAGSNVTAIGKLLVIIFKQSILDEFKVRLIEEMLTLGTLYEDYQVWEEAVTQALTYILNNVFQKTEKDKEKLATVSEQGILSHVNMKKFLKQIRMILEKMFSDVQLDEANVEKSEIKFTRIEEFVEVI